MPTCNLAEIVHNKWLQQFGNKMTYLYEATMDDMICAFMQTTHYRAWLERKSDGKGLDLKSLKLKAVAGVEIQKCWLMPWSFTHGQKIPTPKIAHWKCLSFLVPPNTNSTYHRVLMWVSSIRQSDLFNSSPQLPGSLSTHKRIVKFCRAWCGSYYIYVKGWLSCFQVAHCKINIQLNQTMLGIARYYRDHVQC